MDNLSANDIVWSVADATGERKAAVYYNSTSGEYDLALKGSLIENATLDVDSYWDLESAGKHHRSC